MLPSGSRIEKPSPVGVVVGGLRFTEDLDAGGLAALPDRLRVGGDDVQRLGAGRPLPEERVVGRVGVDLDQAALGPPDLAVHDHRLVVGSGHHDLLLEAEDVDEEPDAGAGVGVGDRRPDAVGATAGGRGAVVEADAFSVMGIFLSGSWTVGGRSSSMSSASRSRARRARAKLGRGGRASTGVARSSKGSWWVMAPPPRARRRRGTRRGRGPAAPRWRPVSGRGTRPPPGRGGRRGSAG